MTRLIDADELKEDLIKFFPTDCLDGIETKTLFNQILTDIDNAPTADDWQKYSDELWKNAYERGKQDARTTCEWVRKEDVIHSIAKQYSEHNEVVPIWLSIGDMRGEEE